MIISSVSLCALRMISMDYMRQAIGAQDGQSFKDIVSKQQSQGLLASLVQTATNPNPDMKAFNSIGKKKTTTNKPSKKVKAREDWKEKRKKTDKLRKNTNPQKGSVKI